MLDGLALNNNDNRLIEKFQISSVLALKMVLHGLLSVAYVCQHGRDTSSKWLLLLGSLVYSPSEREREGSGCDKRNERQGKKEKV